MTMMFGIRSIVRAAAVVGLMALVTSVPAWAQATAQLSGSVKDQSGAVLPGVTVTATQTDTGFTRTVVTDDSGAYVMPNLPTGPYKLDVSLQGFKSYLQTGIVLRVGETPTINAALAVGNLEETVSVEAATPLVDVRSAGINEVVENERIVELPLQGRQVTDLIVLAGAAVNTGNVSAFRGMPGTVAISVAGGLRVGVAYLLDGAMHNNTYDNQNLPLPFPDALQEFSVATGGLSADNGMHAVASVNAVTKSGTNRFAGNAFEFLRDKRFNARNAFAPIGADGKRQDDALRRNQFGGTFGGPIVNDKLFFFGGYQATRTIERPSANIAFVPTAAMIAGDFTALASPACNAGRQITLAAPFVGNRVTPAQLSPAALKIESSGFLPIATDPCGRITYPVPLDRNDYQLVSRVDYQASSNHSLFGRYMKTYEFRLPSLEVTHNALTVGQAWGTNRRARAHSLAFGDTMIFGSNTVNAFRVTWNSTAVRMNDPIDPFFDTSTLGIKVHNYLPGMVSIGATNAFQMHGGDAVRMILDNAASQVSDGLTIVRGSHQIAMGGNLARWTSTTENYARAVGDFTFDGTATGLALADFMTGNLALLRHSGPGLLPLHQWYVGLYAQDTWRATSRVTLNGGLRWEPFLGQQIENGSISNFSLENFQKGVKSGVFKNAPAGLRYPGDPGFPDGKSGMKTQWANVSPRVGFAWDVMGDGRMALRSSYGLAYDFVSAQYLFIAGSAPPFSNRIELRGRLLFEDPYASVPGGQTHPVPKTPTADAAYPGFGAFGTIDPENNSPRVHNWNVTLERQLGKSWQASVSYLGSYADRLWNAVQVNPGLFLGLGPCTLNGVAYPVCTTAANLNQRRPLILENQAVGQYFGAVDVHSDVGSQTYRGLKFSFQRRAASGVSLNGNYTVSNCEGDTESGFSFAQYSAGYLDPNNPSFDRGNCSQNRTHIANVSVGAQSPEFANRGLRVVASGWRVSGIMNARSGSWLTVTTTTDTAATGITGQRLNQVLDDPFGEHTLDTYLNRAAFAQPAAGTLGNYVRNSIEGPAFWTIDLSLSRRIPIVNRQSLELRVETFNLLNNFNWGNPVTNFNAATFGRILSQSGDPRIMQFGIKYDF
ncbi:MAG: carboxypeptidase regulatory-like domain-containing protein [Acidobacteria bacterium]|nr:carboxypeptidase regulatory-like domain-containing protein [Acidobacteriota bacterium]